MSIMSPMARLPREIPHDDSESCVIMPISLFREMGFHFKKITALHIIIPRLWAYEMR